MENRGHRYPDPQARTRSVSGYGPRWIRTPGFALIRFEVDLGTTLPCSIQHLGVLANGKPNRLQYSNRPALKVNPPDPTSRKYAGSVLRVCSRLTCPRLICPLLSLIPWREGIWLSEPD